MPEGDAWDEVMRNLGVDLRNLRLSAHLTQQELAERMGGRQQGWVSEVENGSVRRRPITWDDLSSWLDACGVGPALVEEWRVRYTPIELAFELRSRRKTRPPRPGGREYPALPSETIRIRDALREVTAVFAEELEAAKRQAHELQEREERLTRRLAETATEVTDLELQCHQAEQQITAGELKEDFLRERIRGLRRQLEADNESIRSLEREIRFTREQRRVAEEAKTRIGKRTDEVALRSRTASDLLTVLFEASWAGQGDDPQEKASDESAGTNENKKIAEFRKLEPVTTTWPREVGASRKVLPTLSIIVLAVLLVISLLALVF